MTRRRKEDQVPAQVGPGGGGWRRRASPSPLSGRPAIGTPRHTQHRRPPDLTPKPLGHTSDPSHPGPAFSPWPASPRLRRWDSAQPRGPLPTSQHLPRPSTDPQPSVHLTWEIRGDTPAPPEPSFGSVLPSAGSVAPGPSLARPRRGHPGDSSGGADRGQEALKMRGCPLSKPVLQPSHSSPPASPRHVGACGLPTLVASSAKGSEPLGESGQDERRGVLPVLGPPS